MSVISHIAVDWQRYNITNCEWPWPFPAELVGKHEWELQRPTRVAWNWDLGHVEFVIPKGYQFDGASIPMWAESFVDPINALVGALPHDVLYETQAGWRTYRVKLPDRSHYEEALVDCKTGKPLVFDGDNPPDSERRRARSDAVLRAFWLASGMSLDMADRGYGAVRLAGKQAWDDD